MLDANRMHFTTHKLRAGAASSVQRLACCEHKVETCPTGGIYLSWNLALISKPVPMTPLSQTLMSQASHWLSMMENQCSKTLSELKHLSS